jgi:catechol 2,3-dioxygenase-like lactoylglutathione lyase family enzyme
VLPVSDVDKAKDFYQALNWRLDASYSGGPGYRAAQLTPPRVGLLGDARYRSVVGHVGMTARVAGPASGRMS